MRPILYVANIQSPLLIESRDIRENLSLAGSRKLWLLAVGLIRLGRSVRFVSSGKTGRLSGKRYGAFEEVADERFVIRYMTTVETRVLGNLLPAVELIVEVVRQAVTPARGRLVVVYNITPYTFLALALVRLLKLCPVVLQYEDSIVASRGTGSLSPKRHLAFAENIFGTLCCGAFGPSRSILDRIGLASNLVVEGVVSPRTCNVGRSGGRPSRIPVALRPVLLYSGNLDYSKGLDILMDAFPDDKYCIVITGDGPMRGYVERWCAEKPTTRIFKGLVERVELEAIMTHVDACVNPHRTTLFDGHLWPFKVAEFMAINGIVVSSNMNCGKAEIMARMFVYKEDTPQSLRSIVERVPWASLDESRASNRQWAAQEWNSDAVARKLDAFFSQLEEREPNESAV